MSEMSKPIVCVEVAWQNPLFGHEVRDLVRAGIEDGKFIEAEEPKDGIFFGSATEWLEDHMAVFPLEQSGYDIMKKHEKYCAVRFYDHRWAQVRLSGSGYNKGRHMSYVRNAANSFAVAVEGKAILLRWGPWPQEMDVCAVCSSQFKTDGMTGRREFCPNDSDPDHTGRPRLVAVKVMPFGLF